VGWAIMMVFGAAYRLLPMLLPAAMPSGWRPVASALLLEGGVVGLAISFEGGVGGSGLVLSAAAVTAAFVIFAGQVVWMLRHRRPRAAGLPRPDLGLVHVAQALAYALAALTIGLVLAVADLEPASRLRLVPVYGVFGLLGFLAQMVIGVELRLLPLYGWLRRYAAAGAGEPPPPPYTAASRRLQIATLGSWTLGVPLLATALYLERATLLAVAAWLLLLATVASAWQGLRCARLGMERV
jgi:hypothetical protein